MLKTVPRLFTICLLGGALLLPAPLLAEVPGVAPGIPEPEQRNVIVQMFNHPFEDITALVPELQALGYSHIHVSPPQKSNEKVTNWHGRYQPVDHTTIDGPLGTEAQFQTLIDTAHDHGMQIIADVVLNHTVDVEEQDPPDAFVTVDRGKVVEENHPHLEVRHFHDQCGISGPSEEQTCWLSGTLADLKTTDEEVRQVGRDYLKKLADMGVDGFRFDAAIHIEPEFYPAVLSVTPDAYAFGEIIKQHPSHFSDWVAIEEMDFYDFPLTKTMRDAFFIGGDLQTLKNPKDLDGALPGPKAVTFVRNHDIDRGQNNDRGLEGGRETFGIGWRDDGETLERTDVHLAYAYIFGREDGIPYVFVDMPEPKEGTRDDLHNDPFVVAGIRFHNLSLAGQGGVDRRPEVWRIETQNAIGWQRGDDRFVVINKAAEVFPIRDLQTSLQPGTYKDVLRGWLLHVRPDGRVVHWDVPGRSAMMFVRVGDL